MRGSPMTTRWLLLSVLGVGGAACGCSTAPTGDAPDRNGDGVFGFGDVESTPATEARMGHPRKWEDEIREDMDKQDSDYYERLRD